MCEIFRIRHAGVNTFFVIDTLINNTCCGGVRIKEDLTSNEIKLLAREMTLKLGLLGIRKCGGAKLGVALPETFNTFERTAHLKEIAKKLKHLLGGVQFFPGTDMGSFPNDINIIRGIFGISKGGNVDTAYYTALTVTEAIRLSIYHNLINSKTSRPLTAALQGFGKVGSNIALLLERQDIKLVGISTKKGAIFDKKGLPAKKISNYKHRYGDELVLKYPASHIPKDALLQSNVDILIPCAGIWTLNTKDVHDIKARLIVPAANSPIMSKAEKILTKKGICCLPSFLCNCGGIAGGPLERKYGQKNANKVLLNLYRERFSYIINAADGKLEHLHCLAESIALERFRNLKKKMENP